MAAAGMTLQDVSARIGELDPAKGVSFQSIAFVATDKRWARESTTTRNADLIEDALSAPRGSLFLRSATPPAQPAGQDPAWADL